MTAGLPIRPAPAAFRISTASPILLHPSLFTVFRVVPTLVSHENDSQKTRVSSLAGMEVEPSTWYSSRVTLPSHDLAHWCLTSQPCLCSNHHSTWAHYDGNIVKKVWWTDRQTDGQTETDRQTDRRTDGRTDGQTEPFIELVGRS